VELGQRFVLDKVALGQRFGVDKVNQKISKSIYNSKNPTSLVKEFLVQDRVRQDMQGRKGDRVYCV
jgi:hypothetical protein